MSGAKETPRQKMIGMMYLFYTALLALNISSDILNAFVLVNDSMSQTNSNFNAKNGLLMNAFANQYSQNPEKVAKYYNKAKQIQALSDTLVEYLREVQDKLIIGNEFGDKFGDIYISDTEFRYVLEDINGEDSIVTFDRAYKIPTGFLKLKDKYNIPMEILKPEQVAGVREPNSDGIVEGDGEALILKAKFENYNKAVIATLDPADAATIKLSLNTDNVYNSVARIEQTWQYNSFYHTVIVADLVILKKYVSEVMNTEAEVIAKLYGYIDAQSMKFDAVRAAVIPQSNVVISGSDYEADIFVAAYSRTEVPVVYIKTNIDSLATSAMNSEGITRIDTATDGITKYRVKTGATGEFKYAGFIHVKGPDGKEKPYYFNSSYQVIKPTATVSADKVNVVYRKIKNPISVSAPGFTNDKVRLSVSGAGSLVGRGDGHYDFTPTATARDIKFSVSATKGDGSTVNLGTFPFRALPIPPPTIRLAGKSEGAIDRAVLASSPFVTANLDDFLFELKYVVIQFEIIAASNRGTIVNQVVRGNKLPSDVVTKLQRAPKGTIVIISSVNTRGDGGDQRAPGVTLKLN